MADAPMTPTTLAAALIKDVPRYGYANVDLRPDENGDWLNRDAVLAALTAALSPAPDVLRRMVAT